MKYVLINNIIVAAVFTICVTIAAINFNRAGILFWYMIVPWLNFSYKETVSKKGDGDAEQK